MQEFDIRGRYGFVLEAQESIGFGQVEAQLGGVHFEQLVLRP